MSTIVDGQGLNITVQSYLDTLDFGLVACRELVPDLWDMLDAIVEDLEGLAKAAGDRLLRDLQEDALAGALLGGLDRGVDVRLRHRGGALRHLVGGLGTAVDDVGPARSP